MLRAINESSEHQQKPDDENLRISVFSVHLRDDVNKYRGRRPLAAKPRSEKRLSGGEREEISPRPADSALAESMPQPGAG